MKKKLNLKNNSKKRKINFKVFFFIFINILFISLTFNYLLEKNININSKVLVNYLLKDTNYHLDTNTKIDIDYKINILDLLKINYMSLENIENKKSITKTSNKNKEPLIYLYNTHQTEEYKADDLLYSINPTVTINNYIMKEVFENNNLPTVVEERSIKDILNLNSWNYSSSYRASRVYLEDIKKTYNSLTYFIDIHRDSLKKDKTTVSIDGKNYAKVLFIVGLENKNYQENLAFTTKINDQITSKYPTLSRGIYKKEGPSVNGIYNQDFSKYTILIEIGGVDNSILEVMNTSLIVSNIISEVINQNEA